MKGFSLLEILIVLVIGVLLVTLVPPLLSGLYNTAEVRSAARAVAAGLRSARDEAVIRQHEALFTLDVAQRRFQVTGIPHSTTLPETISLQLFTTTTEQVSHQVAHIRFFSDGSSTGGHIIVANDRQTYRVTVDWLTGAVAVQDVPASTPSTP